MILERIFISRPEARLLPAEKLHTPTVALLAIMTFAMLVVAAAGLALANAASAVARGTEHRFVIQIPSASAERLPLAVEATRSIPGVRSVEAVSELEMRKTLETWLGSAASNRDLPVPAMATVDLAPGADSAALASAVSKAVPDAVVTGEAAELQPVLGSIRALQWLAMALVALMAAATSAAIVLASRGALDTHRPTVEIMHGIGATDLQVTRMFQRKIALDAVTGAAAGGAAATLVLVFLAGTIAAAVSGLAPKAPLGTADLLLLALIPPAAVLLVILVAHRTLRRALRETL